MQGRQIRRRAQRRACGWRCAGCSSCGVSRSAAVGSRRAIAARDRGALRATGTKDALNPVWGAQGHRVRPPALPAGGCAGLQPVGDPARRHRPAARHAPEDPVHGNGLVPLDLSADGGRLLAGFTGPDTLVGFTVDPQSGATRALSKDVEQALVGYDLSADGSTILGHTGGPDPVLPGACAQAGTLARTSDTAGGGSSTIAHEPASSCSAAQFRWRSSLPKTSMNTSITVAPGSRATLSVQPASRRLSPKWFSCRRNASPS